MQRYLAASVLLMVWIASWSEGAEPVGWRTNGTGAYPQAMPPRTWAADKNVVWRTKMPGFSNASPIILGDKLFVCSEPGVLLCVQLADGKILWQKDNAYQDVVLPPALKEKLEAEQKPADALLKQIRDIDTEMAALRKKIALNPDDKDALQKKHEDCKTQTVALKTKLNDFPLAAKFRTPEKNSVGGFSAPTPVSDGKHVFVAFGNGLVACYDLDGNRQWLQLIEHSTAPYGHGASPLLVGDKLLIHYADLAALNTKDGSEAWRVKLPPNHGTPIHARIGDSDVAIHPNGLLVRVADGAVLADKLGSTGPNSPLLQDGIIYFIRPEARAVKVPTDLAAPLKPEILWKARLTGSGYWFASPILHDGLIYGCNAMGILSVVEAKTGQLVYEKRLPFGAGQVYPSITLAGGLLFISSDEGVTLVLEPGREYKELARNTLEPFRSTPVFQGKRMYVRCKEHLYCIGE
jgi:outer membrane protein assembly factor BamB